MGLLNWLTGSKDYKRAADIQARAEAANRNTAAQYGGQNMADLDASLAGALGELNAGQSGATNALQPWAAGGGNALDMILNALGLGGAGGRANALSAFQAGPGYEFAMGQGVNALDRSAAARGNLYSGAQGKALTQFGQGLANQEWGNWLDKLLGLSSAGQNAATNQANVLTNFAGSRADALLGTGINKVATRGNVLDALTGFNSNAAAAKAGGITAAANARNNLLGTGVNALALLLGRKT